MGTRGVERLPSDVRIGDYVLVGGLHHKIVDMRAGAGHRHKVLIFSTGAVWTMDSPRMVYRPIVEGGHG
ncbi:hypothetical protein QR77_17525 [Streptomyces sp. 150FB]|nr:hypothetical protein QR77_17525 [Streptomyces sp. 150FB]